MLRLACVLAVSLVSSSFLTAHAGVILQQPGPDILLSPLTGIYDAGTEELTIGGAASQLVYADGTTQTIFMGTNPWRFFTAGNGFFMLNATVDSQGVLERGSFTITGYLDSDGDGTADDPTPTAVTLLQGTLTEMHRSAFDVGEIDFVAAALTGTLVSHFPGEAGIKFYASSPISFHDSFKLEHTAVADLGRSVPEPASIVMWAVMLVSGGMRKFRHSAPC